MPRHEEAQILHSVGRDTSDRDALLTPSAAAAWLEMKEIAARSGIELLVISAFRSIARQRAILESKLEAGVSWSEILAVSAYPGFSEHHTGRAVDVGAPGCEELTERFEATDQFKWLSANAHRFGFSLSYPRDNRFGVIYEPWHWCYT
jgi:D-alanyl-D-alanine carboxypeptidase